MNCIYQGRVSKVEIPGLGHRLLTIRHSPQAQPLDLDVLWRHHELFQDAVNFN